MIRRLHFLHLLYLVSALQSKFVRRFVHKCSLEQKSHVSSLYWVQQLQAKVAANLTKNIYS